MSLFQKAEKSQVKLRLAITGPAGSGKTLGALKLARGLVGPQGKIAVIDTENGTASLYADRFSFDVASVTPPYLVSKYTDAITQAASGGYDCVIVDSLSHAWAGEGGILQRKEQIDARGGNSFTNWGKMTPEQNALVSSILHSKTNIICTMRSKTEYSLEKDSQGKATPKKLGLAPVQREGFEYEFDIVLDIDVDTHTAKPSKDRTGVFGETIIKLDEKHGAAIAAWQGSSEPAKPNKSLEAPTAASPVSGGASSTVAPPQQVNQPAVHTTNGKVSDAQIKRMFAIAKGAGYDSFEVKAKFIELAGDISSKDLTRRKYDEVVTWFQNNPNEKEPDGNIPH